MSEDIKISVIADSEQAKQMFDQINRKLDAMGDSAEKAGKRAETGTGRMIAGYMSAQVAIGAATELLRQHNAETERAIKNSRDLENNLNRLSVQGSLSRSKDPATTKQIAGIAQRNAVGVDQAATAAEQLISAGFSTQDALTGGATDAFLQGLNSMNAAGRDTDPKQMAMAMVRFLKGTGQSLSKENIAGLNVPLFNLFKNTDVQAGDLEFLGSKASPLTQLGRMSPNEILAAFSVVRDVKGPAEASTSLGSLVSRLAGASSNQEAVEAISRMGMKPGEIDFVGENFATVMKRIRGGVNRLPESDRAGVLRKLGSQENLDTLTTLLANVETYEARGKGLDDMTSYRMAIGRHTQGLGAEERRTEARRAVIDQGPGAAGRKADLFIERGLAEMDEQGAPYIVSRGMAMFYRALKFIDPALLENAYEETKPPETKVEIIDPGGNKMPGSMRQNTFNNGF